MTFHNIKRFTGVVVGNLLIGLVASALMMTLVFTLGWFHLGCN